MIKNNGVHAARTLAERYRSGAAAKRKQAKLSTRNEARTALLSVAETFEHIAESVERDVKCGVWHARRRKKSIAMTNPA
jgi:hypothetical protein